MVVERFRGSYESKFGVEGDIAVMATEDDIQFMRLALEQALKGRRTPGGAEVGAVLVRDEVSICAGFNEGELHHDPTAHAEMVVIRRACAQLQKTSLQGCTLYCTLQPCGMCTMACLWAGVSKIVYGAGREDVNHIYFKSRHNDTFDFIRDAFRADLRIEGGVLAEDCANLYAKPEESVSKKGPAHVPTIPPR
ncbi:nucleoside deaminase [Edaphobacter aggregans]|uniref:nucleoside deaminase n=1 Tax=Edaphobacter aggregans TaxID=570835 RepID=UPI000AD12783|nr:nucleoside deaminase [Edaphobacter aggregans]